MNESEPLLPTTTNSSDEGECSPTGAKKWQFRTGAMLESEALHKVVLALIAIDAVCVITDLSYTFLRSPPCSGSQPETDLPVWLEVLSHISLVITILFLIEIPLTLWAFGWRFYDPVHGKDHGFHHTPFHLLDAVVILGSFVSDVFLRGRERELASLIVLLRLWRLLKLVGGVAVGVDEMNEADTRALVEARREVLRLQKQVQELERRLAERDPNARE